MKPQALAALLLSCLIVGCASTQSGVVSAGDERSRPGPPPDSLLSASTVSGTEREIELLALQRLLVDRQLYEPYTVEQSLLAGPTVRLGLARALGQITDSRTLSSLESLLQDASVEVRRAAAFSLGQQEPGSDTGALRLALRDGDAVVGRYAVESLGKWDSPLELVEQGLVGLSAEEAWERLLPSLFRFEESRTVSLAIQALDLEEPSLRRWAAYALTRNPRPEGLPAIRGLLQAESAEVRGWAARALGRVGESEDLDRLLPRLSDPEAASVVQALRAGAALLDRLGLAPPEDWRPALRRLVDDQRPGIGVTAIEAAAGWLRDEELSPRLTELVRSESDAAGHERRRVLALAALVAGEEPHVDELVELLAQSPSPVLRSAAADAAVRRGREDLVATLAADGAPRVRASVLSGRLEVESESDAALMARQAFADDDPVVRALALHWLAEHPVVPYEPILVALGHAWNERMLDARLAAIAALEARAEASTTERSAIVLALLEMADAPEFLLRRRVAAALQQLEGASPPVGAAETPFALPAADLERKLLGIYRDILIASEAAPRVRLETTRGPVVLELRCIEAPLTCHRFLQLVGNGFYDGLRFHRVVPGFVVQAGDPRGDGWGGPGYSIRDEINPLRYERGVLGMALSGPDTGGSQFFLTLAPQPHLDGGYTAFGVVVSGMEVLDQIEQGDQIVRFRRLDESTTARVSSPSPLPGLQPSLRADVVSRDRGTH